MWDFEADLSQTVLDKSEDEKDGSQINDPENMSNISKYNTHYR